MRGQITSNWGLCYVVWNIFSRATLFFCQSFWIKIHMNDLWAHKIVVFITWELKLYVNPMWFLFSFVSHIIWMKMLNPPKFESWWVMWMFVFCDFVCASFWFKFTLIVILKIIVYIIKKITSTFCVHLLPSWSSHDLEFAFNYKLGNQ